MVFPEPPVPVPIGFSTLYHEIGLDPVESKPIIEPFCASSIKFFVVIGRFFFIELELYCPLFSDDSGDPVFPVSPGTAVSACGLLPIQPRVIETSTISTIKMYFTFIIIPGFFMISE